MHPCHSKDGGMWLPNIDCCNCDGELEEKLWQVSLPVAIQTGRNLNWFIAAQPAFFIAVWGKSRNFCRYTLCERYGLRHVLPGIWPKEAGPIDALDCNLTLRAGAKDRVRAAAENRQCYCTWCFCAQSQSASQLSLLRLFSILLCELSTFTADTLWMIREWNTVPGASLLNWFPRACIDIHFASWQFQLL